MAKSSIVAPEGATIKIPEDQWVSFLDEFTRQNRGAHATLEVLGPGVGYQVETENKPFEGISSDVKDGERNVWITFGGDPENHVTHGIQNVSAIWVRLPTATSGAAMEIEAHDGTKTLLELSRPEDYALPPPEDARPS
jgi:hypothetical protein